MYWTYFSRGIFYQSKSDERKNIFEPQTSKTEKYFFHQRNYFIKLFFYVNT